MGDDQVAINKGIPLPAKSDKKYPWNEMEVGDSFVAQTLSVYSAVSSTKLRQQEIYWT